MRKLTVFNSVSLDGYFTDEKGDMSWAHKYDPEWLDYTESNAKIGGVLLFGRKTYEMMVSFWPTEQAKKTLPHVAEGMNKSEKVVFSRTLKEVRWENTKLVDTDMVDAVRKMKNESGPDLVLMGSGTIVSQLTGEGLIDGYQIVLSSVVLGKGRTMFEGVSKKIPLKLTGTRAFENGNVVLTYVV